MDYPDVVHALAEELGYGRLSVLAGAGISVDSGFPMAWELIGEILALACCTEEERTAVMGSRAAFEAVMSELEFVGSAAMLEHLFAAAATPGPAHHLLATLAARGRIDRLATTNFDTLLEAALEQGEGLRPGPGYAVEVPGFTARTDPSAAVRVVKLHGSAHLPGSIAATLATVASTQHQAPRAAAVGDVFGGEGSVLIIGYSCSDHFDIVPAIRALPVPRRRVFWIDHAPADAASFAVTRLDGHPVFRDYEAYRVRCDARSFVSGLGGAAGVPLPPRPDADTPEWRPVLERWVAPMDDCDRSRAIAAILFRAGRYDQARTRFGHAARQAEEAGDGLRAMDSLTSKGYIESELGLAHEALRTQQATAAAALRAGHLQMIGATHANLGIAYFEADEFEQALQAHLVSVGAATALRDARRVGSRLGNLANALMGLEMFAEARTIYHDSLRTARECGDPDSMFTACLGHGIASAELQEWDAAGEMLAAARQLAANLGYEQGLAQVEAARTMLAGRRT